MNQKENIKALRDAIEEANTKEMYGLYNIKNIIIEIEELEKLKDALDLLEAGFSLTNYILTREQRKLLKAYSIDVDVGKTIKAENIKEIEERK